jgi:iron complex outermembrane receptor protein
VELGLGALTTAGPFANVALTFSRNRYAEYVVDSTLLGAPGATADYAGNEAVGVPSSIAHVELGSTVPGYRALRVRGALEHAGRYFADDANAVRVPGYTVLHLTAELRAPLATAGGWGVRGFVSVQNVTDRAYVGSAFLNPDRLNGAPLAFEPGMPRSVVVSVTIGKVR